MGKRNLFYYFFDFLKHHRSRQVTHFPLGLNYPWVIQKDRMTGWGCSLHSLLHSYLVLYESSLWSLNQIPMSKTGLESSSWYWQATSSSVWAWKSFLEMSKISLIPNFSKRDSFQWDMYEDLSQHSSVSVDQHDCSGVANSSSSSRSLLQRDRVRLPGHYYSIYQRSYTALTLNGQERVPTPSVENSWTKRSSAFATTSSLSHWPPGSVSECH